MQLGEKVELARGEGVLGLISSLSCSGCVSNNSFNNSDSSLFSQMVFGEGLSWSLSHDHFALFSLPSPAVDRSERATSVAAWNPAREQVQLPQNSASYD